MHHYLRRESNSYGLRRVGPRGNFFDTFNDCVDGRFKELLNLVPEGGVRDRIGLPVNEKTQLTPVS